PLSRRRLARVLARALLDEVLARVHPRRDRHLGPRIRAGEALGDREAEVVLPAARLLLDGLLHRRHGLLDASGVEVAVADDLVRLRAVREHVDRRDSVAGGGAAAALVE